MVEPARLVEEEAFGRGCRKRPIAKINTAVWLSRRIGKGGALGRAVRVRPDRPGLAEVDKHTIETRIAQDLGHAVGDVALADPVQTDRHSPPREAKAIRGDADVLMPYAFRCAGDSLGRRAFRIGIGRAEMIRIETPERLDGDIEYRL